MTERTSAEVEPGPAAAAQPAVAQPAAARGVRAARLVARSLADAHATLAGRLGAADRVPERLNPIMALTQFDPLAAVSVPAASSEPSPAATPQRTRKAAPDASGALPSQRIAAAPASDAQPRARPPSDASDIETPSGSARRVGAAPWPEARPNPLRAQQSAMASLTSFAQRLQALAEAATHSIARPSRAAAEHTPDRTEAQSTTGPTARAAEPARSLDAARRFTAGVTQRGERGPFAVDAAGSPATPRDTVPALADEWHGTSASVPMHASASHASTSASLGHIDALASALLRPAKATPSSQLSSASTAQAALQQPTRVGRRSVAQALGPAQSFGSVRDLHAGDEASASAMPSVMPARAVAPKPADAASTLREPDELARAVNEALVEQARLYGMDVS